VRQVRDSGRAASSGEEAALPDHEKIMDWRGPVDQRNRWCSGQVTSVSANPRVHNARRRGFLSREE